MKAFRHYARAMVLLLCSALLLARTGGEHLHLCLDGQEPRAAIHGPDGYLEHHGSSAGQPHDDRDVALQTAATAKSPLVISEVPPIIVAPRFGELAALVQVLWTSSTAPAHVVSTARHLRPQQRGPPA